MPPAFSPGVCYQTEGRNTFFFLLRLISADQERELKPCTKCSCHTVFMPIFFSRKCGNTVESSQRTEFCRCVRHINPQVWHVCTGVKLDYHKKAEGIF